jgi:ribosomal protein L35
MDYGKFRYEEAQRIKESRKKTIQITMKEVKFKPKIGKGDFNTKVRHIHEFLEEGHKVKVTLQFRGREMAHPELGTKILDAVIEDLGQLARVDTMARLEGRNMTMVLSPEKKAAAKKPTNKPQLQHQLRHQYPSKQLHLLKKRQYQQPNNFLSTNNLDRNNRRHTMPKMKTSKTTAKRFKTTGTGKLRRQQSMRQHLFEHKASTRTRRLDGSVDVHSGDVKRIKRLLGMR